MCGRFTLRTPANLIAKYFNLDPDAQWQAALRYNVAPTQDIPVIRAVDGRRSLSMMRWGLVPSWADDPKIGYKMINARSEEAATKPSFRAAMKKRRCLIVADGFYEWQIDGKKKQPYYIRRPDGKPFAFAGLWESWGKVDPPLETCTILTMAAGESTKWLHHRVPVILSPNDYDMWTNPGENDPAKLAYLFEPLPDGELVASAVNPVMNNARHEGPDCIEQTLVE